MVVSPPANQTVEITAEEMEAALAPPPIDLTNTTRLYWGINSTHGPAAYSVTVDLREDNPCELGSRLSYGVAANGVNAVRMITFENGYSWSSAGSSDAAYVHGLGIDTRSDDAATSAGGGGTTWWKGTFSGRVEFTFLALEFRPTTFGDEVYLPAAITIQCDDPFGVVDARTGDDLAFFHPSRADGQMGGGASGVAEAGVDLSWRHELGSGDGRLALAGFGDQVLDGAIVTPDGAEPFTSTASSFFERRETTAGPQGFDLDWAGADFYAIWGSVYSVPEMLDLHAGLHNATTAGESPF